MHGGAKTQFDTVPMNLCAEPDKHTVEYIISGSWSKMAAKEAEKFAKVVAQKVNKEN
jgi:phosphoserine aminotransferase